MSNFKQDLEAAQGIENEVRQLIYNDRELLFDLTKWYSSSTMGRFDGWDLKVGFSVEVKHDIKSSVTGNIAFEYSSGNNVSGIMASKSTYTVYVTEDWYLIFNTTTLKQELVNKSAIKTSTTGFRKITGGDNNNSNMYLYRKDYVLNNFQSLIHKIGRNK
jgi:hypothetical protein